MGFPLSPLWCHSVFGSAVWCVITHFSNVVMLASRSILLSLCAVFVFHTRPFTARAIHSDAGWEHPRCRGGSCTSYRCVWYLIGHERDLYCFILYCKIK